MHRPASHLLRILNAFGTALVKSISKCLSASISKHNKLACRRGAANSYASDTLRLQGEAFLRLFSFSLIPTALCIRHLTARGEAFIRLFSYSLIPTALSFHSRGFVCIRHLTAPRGGFPSPLFLLSHTTALSFH